MRTPSPYGFRPIGDAMPSLALMRTALTLKVFAAAVSGVALSAGQAAMGARLLAARAAQMRRVTT